MRLADIGRKLDRESGTLEHTDELRRPARTCQACLERDDTTLNQIRERLSIVCMPRLVLVCMTE